MKVRLTHIKVVQGVKDTSKEYIQVSGVKTDGTVFTGMCQAPVKLPEVDITAEELETYSSHEVNFDIGRDGKAYLTDVKPSAE